uniref:Glycosyltransferase n=1 Tax=Thermodesulfobacterium geofontis TaxID=1295609 RepID=A0A7V6CCV9_9BACT
MKVMDITPYYHQNSGGIKTYLNNKIKWLEDKDIEHVVVIPGERERIYYFRKTKFYEVSSFKLIGEYRFFKSLIEINDIISEEKPDVVELGGTYLLIPFLKRRDYILSVFYHADAEKEIELLPLPKKLKREFFKFVIEKCLAQADVLLVSSQKYERILRQFGLSKVFYTPLGIDVELFTPLKYDPSFRRRFGIKEDVFLLLYVGRLSPEKGIKNLLKAFSILDPACFHLIIVGKGPLEFLIEYYKKNLSNLTYISYLSHDELSFVYASADIFVSASKFETFGFSFLEAEASGLPVCAFDLDLETQFIKEILAKERTPENLAEKIIQATKLLSPNLRKDLYEKVKFNFSLDKTFKRIFQVYTNLMYLICQDNFQALKL